MEFDELLDLPEDRELAFFQIARMQRKIFDDIRNFESNPQRLNDAKIDYINNIVTAADALGIDDLCNFVVPQPHVNADQEFRKLDLKLQQFTLRIRIVHSRRAKSYSVALDDGTKAKIKHHLDQLKEVVAKLEISEQKRDAIIRKIFALEEEIQRSRTRFEVFAALILESATVAGEAGERLEPWRKWIDSISRLLGIAKDKDQDPPSLPSPPEKKQLPSPKDPGGDQEDLEA